MKNFNEQEFNFLLKVFRKGMDYSAEIDIDNHTSTIGHTNPYGDKDPEEVLKDFLAESRVDLKKRYDRMEDNNDHTGAAKLLIDNFGTEDEQRIMSGIAHRHEVNGFISPTDYQTRYEISDKYYELLTQ